MIKGIRAAIICREVITPEHGAPDLLEITGDILAAESRPGFLHKWIYVQLDLDKTATPIWWCGL
jgi:hypothetical protein